MATNQPPDNTEPAQALPNGTQADAGDAAPPVPAIPESRLPTRKDTSLKELLNKMDDYAPIVRSSPTSLLFLCTFCTSYLCGWWRSLLTLIQTIKQIPDAVTNYYMTRAGLPPPPQTDQRLARLLALATQKFIADIAADAYQYSRIRASNTSANNPMGNLGAAAGFPIPGAQPGGQPGGAKDQGKGGPIGIQRPGFGGGGQGGSQNRTVLTMEDLGMAVGEYGVNVKRSEFYR